MSFCRLVVFLTAQFNNYSHSYCCYRILLDVCQIIIGVCERERIISIDIGWWNILLYLLSQFDCPHVYAILTTHNNNNNRFIGINLCTRNDYLSISGRRNQIKSYLSIWLQTNWFIFLIENILWITVASIFSILIQ